MTYQTKRDLASGGGFLLGVAIAWLVWFSCGCAPVHPPRLCETACGMYLAAPPPTQDVYDGGSLDESTALLPWWTCDNLNAIEAQSLQALNDNAARYDDRFEPHTACRALEGVSVTVRRERHWWDGSDAGYVGNDAWVVGLTSCRSGTPRIQVANREPANGVLTHEMAHAIQSCEPKGPKPLVGQDPDYAGDSDPDHLNWTRYGIYAAELQVMMIDAAERMRRDVCAGDAGCTFDAGVIP